MATITNQNKNNASLTNTIPGEANKTWDQSTLSWDATPGTWDHQTTYLVISDNKHSATITNQAKS